MDSDEHTLMKWLLDIFGLKKLFRMLTMIDDIYNSTGYGGVQIEIRDKRIAFINHRIDEDVRGM